MYSGATVFSRLMQQLPWWRFQTFVDRDQGDYKVKTFRCAEPFRVMAFAALLGSALLHRYKKGKHLYGRR